jgi:hypothetical protein
MIEILWSYLKSKGLSSKAADDSSPLYCLGQCRLRRTKTTQGCLTPASAEANTTGFPRLGDVPPWNVPWNVPAGIDRY